MSARSNTDASAHSSLSVCKGVQGRDSFPCVVPMSRNFCYFAFLQYLLTAIVVVRAKHDYLIEAVPVTVSAQSSGIRTHDPSVKAGEDISCHCDRHLIPRPCFIFINENMGICHSPLYTNIQVGPKVSLLLSKIYTKILETALLLTEFTKNCLKPDPSYSMHKSQRCDTVLQIDWQV
jgi:hypothetical protein